MSRPRRQNGNSGGHSICLSRNRNPSEIFARTIGGPFGNSTLGVPKPNDDFAWVDPQRFARRVIYEIH
jgi:hypothetical protein